MKKRKVWNIKPLFIIIIFTYIFFVTTLFFTNKTFFYLGLGIALIAVGLILFQIIFTQRTARQTVSSIISRLDTSDQNKLKSFPVPSITCSTGGEILWYNDLFLTDIFSNKEAFGQNINALFSGISFETFGKRGIRNTSFGEKKYSVFLSTERINGKGIYTLFFVDDTELKFIAEEYTLSKPVVMLFFIDNLEELNLQSSRENERAHLSGLVGTFLEEWTRSMSGIIRKYGTERFMIIIEHRYIDKVIDSKFEILSKTKTVKTSDNKPVTISAGVSEGETLQHAEQNANQALEMALGRGGDQVAVKSGTGYKFFGGLSQGVEKHTKVRTRMVASALLELIKTSDVIFLMGHRYSDLDSIGASVAMVSKVRSLGKEAFVVVRKEQSLASTLIERYVNNGQGDYFVNPQQISNTSGVNILTIIVDTHNPKTIEHPPLSSASNHVVVIDHHRKMVDFIDDAVIFYHEPNASSASEMVAELVQYMGGQKPTKLDSEALLSGIMLDTKNFVLKCGVRTFEAAAYLRSHGADTVEVKKLFSGSLLAYKEKISVIANAEIYNNCALSVCSAGNMTDSVRIIAAQAADELLYIENIQASFVIFLENNIANVSARSFGEINVQLIMEDLGGGGHLTMAGAQLPDTSVDQCKKLLFEAINSYIYSRSK